MDGAPQTPHKPRHPPLTPPPVPPFSLLPTFRLYSYAYFWLDDFNNLHWVRLSTFPEALGLIISPSAEAFRPTGMLVYKLAYALFGRDSRPYHWIVWGIH